MAVADTWAGSAQPDLNHGTELTMLVGPQERSFLRFDLSGIPAGATITVAELTVCRANSSGSARTHELRAATTAWTETGLTWNTMPSLAASAIHTIAVPSSTGCVVTSVKEDVQAWVLGAASFGWRITDLDEASAPLVAYQTREEPVSGLRPTLQVTYTP